MFLCLCVCARVQSPNKPSAMEAKARRFLHHATKNYEVDERISFNDVLGCRVSKKVRFSDSHPPLPFLVMPWIGFTEPHMHSSRLRGAVSHECHPPNHSLTHQLTTTRTISNLNLCLWRHFTDRCNQLLPAAAQRHSRYAVAPNPRPCLLFATRATQKLCTQHTHTHTGAISVQQTTPFHTIRFSKLPG